MKQLLSLLPDHCLVGLITFGALVALHELSSDLPKAYVFRGDRALSGSQVKQPYTLSTSKSAWLLFNFFKLYLQRYHSTSIENSMGNI